jgi:hypothetical protein
MTHRLVPWLDAPVSPSLVSARRLVLIDTKGVVTRSYACIQCQAMLCCAVLGWLVWAVGSS